MILGIGSDICDARRIAKVIERHGDRFIDRIFTPAERAKAERRRNRVETYAKRFAAKEACAKALGTGLRAGDLIAVALTDVLADGLSMVYSFFEPDEADRCLLYTSRCV